MNFRLNGRKKAALLAALLSGCLMAQPVFADEFTAPLTGGEDTVYAEKGIKAGETYTFTGDNAINIAATDENNKMGRQNNAGISIAGPGNYVINAGDALAINVKGDHQYNKGIFYANSTAPGDYNLTINGESGPVVIDVEAGKKARGVETFTRNANITVNSGLVVTGIKASDEAFGVKATADSVINLNGSMTIIQTTEQGEEENAAKNTAGLYADSDNAVINVNYKDGAVVNPENVVQIVDDIYTLSKDEDGVKSKGTVNLALTNPQSRIRGRFGYRSGEEYGGDEWDPTVITYGPGEVNLILQNGGTWENVQNYGNEVEEWEGFKGSHVTTLTGGSGMNDAGAMILRDDKPITVEQLNGFVNVYLDHEWGNPGNFIGGDIHIIKAQPGSGILLAANNDGVDMEDPAAVSNVLNNMANKLYYHAYVTGERNLTGSVQIAESLSSPTVSLYLGDITFKEEDGQGTYVASPAGRGSGPIIAPETLTADKTVNVIPADISHDGEHPYAPAVYGMTSLEPTSADSPMVVDMDGHQLDITVSNPDDPSFDVVTGVLAAANDHIKITNSKGKELVLDVTNGNTLVAEGISAQGENATILVEAPVHLTRVGNSGPGLHDVSGVTASGADADVTIKGKLTIDSVNSGFYYDVPDYEKSIGILAGSPTDQWNSSVTVTGPVDIKGVQGSALNVEPNAVLNIGGGSIDAGSDTTKEYVVAFVEGGTANINMKNDDLGIAPTALKLNGDVMIRDETTDGVLNINLPGEQSSWTGMVRDNSDRSKTSFNLNLTGGATWTVKQMSALTGTDAVDAVRVTNLTGDTKYKKFGAILMQDERPLEIDNVSGNVNVYYAHDEATPTQMKGGDVKVGKAAPRSTITMVTDSLGMDAKSKKWADREKVGEVLSALASKLYYTGYTSGEKNLTGRVSIAEGLTSSSASLRLETMGFKDENGQGVYVAPVIDAIEAPETFEKDRVALVAAGNLTYGFDAASMFAGDDVAPGSTMVVDMNGHSLSLETLVPQRAGVNVIFIEGNKSIKVVNEAKKEIHLKGEAGSESVRAIRLSGKESKLELEGPVFVDSLKTGGGIIGGIYTVGKDSKVIVDGSLSFHNMKAEKLTDSASTAVLNTTGDGSMIVVTGPVDISDTQGILLNAQKTNSRIAVGGGTLDATSEGGSNIAIYTHDGQADVNVPDADLGVTSHTTVIKGDVQTDPYFSDSVINIALTDDQSSWTGGTKIGPNGGGNVRSEVNLTLQNGATWNAKSLSDLTRDTGDKPVKSINLITLTGGSDGEHAGIIRPDSEETRPIQILNYSGNTKVFYDHDETDPTRVKGSDLRIMKAAENSGITLVTGNTGLNTDSTAKADKEKVDSVLNAMANKLYYNAYTTGERNLTGKVEIAEGLTSTSASKRLEDITFKEEDGQGQYIATAAPEPEPELPDWHNVPITGNTDADADPSQKTFEKAGILKDGVYTFNEDTTLTAKDSANVVVAQKDVKINAAGHTLTMNQEGRSDATNLITQEEGQNVEITADKLVLDNRGTGARAEGIHLSNRNEDGKLTVNGDTEITAEGSGYALGIYAIGKSTVTMNGKVKMNNGENWAVNSGGSNYYDASAVYASGNMGGQEGAAKIVLNDDIDLKVNANGLYANIGGASIDAKGGTIELNKGTKGTYAALMASNGTVNMNVVKDGSGKVTGADSHKVTIKGNVTASTSAVFGADKAGKDTRINLGLSTADSSFTGLVVNQFPDEGKEAQGTTFTGEISLYLQNGATWNNELYGKLAQGWGAPAFEGSKVANLTGGSDESKSGVIFQKNGKNITIDNYSGFTKVFYEHEAAAPATTMRAAAAAPAAAPVTFKGGDITIKKAAAGSGITLVTDNTGIDMTDADGVNATLNALAGKLFYTAHTTGEENLAGKVQIAEGLTASSASVRLEDITYKDENGQGQYIAPVVPEPEPEKDFHNVPITGNTAEDAEPSQKPFVKEGILKDGVYTFDKDTTLTAKDTASVVAPQDNVKINAAGHTLTMNQEGRTDATSLISEEEGKNIEITADKLVLDNRGTGARAEGIHLANVNDEGKLTVNGDTEITAEGKGYALGIYALGKSTVTMNGKVKMNNGDGWAVSSGGSNYYDASAVYASGNMGGKEGAAKIVLNDDIDLKVNANGLYANIGGASIDAKGGSIEMNKSGNGDYSALMASNGTVNMNVVKDSTGNVTGADNHKVTIKGNMTASTSAVFGADKGGKDTRINLGLSTPDSSFTGVVVNQFPVEGKEAQGTTFTGETNLYLENGATWNNEKYGKVNKAWGGPDFAGSDVTILNGGASADKAGFIRQKDEKTITVRNYKGFTKVAYEHDADTPTTIKGGDFNVGKAAAGSGITLMTDNAGLNTASKAEADKKLVTDTLTALAGKLKYEAYKTGEKNLAGKVEIAEGLTASSASLDTRDIVFTDEGVGTLAKDETPGSGEVDPGTGGEQPGGGQIEYGDKETVMMRGAKTAMASSAMVWRNTNSDLQQRLGDVRLGREDVGIWAKYKGGKLSMDSQKTDLNAKYNSFSVGFDKEIGGNWLVGGAISHLTGDGTYREGTGDLKQTDFTAYGTKVTEDGQYLDMVAKVGQLKNDFHVVNEMGHKLDGDYKANGMSFSVEYGKRFVQDNGFYIDSSVQFTVGRIGGKDFDAASDFKDGKGGFKSMHIQQDAFTSSVGRLGLTVGQQADNYNAFAKMVLAHEFSGAFDTAFSAEGEAQGSKTHLDLKDTWFELEVGGSAKISETSYLYGSFARSMGGDVTNKWRVDAGVRFSF